MRVPAGTGQRWVMGASLEQTPQRGPQDCRGDACTLGRAQGWLRWKSSESRWGEGHCESWGELWVLLSTGNAHEGFEQQGDGEQARAAAVLEVQVQWKGVHGEGSQHQDVLHGASQRSPGQRGVTWEWGRRIWLWGSLRQRGGGRSRCSGVGMGDTGVRDRDHGGPGRGRAGREVPQEGAGAVPGMPQGCRYL